MAGYARGLKPRALARVRGFILRVNAEADVSNLRPSVIDEITMTEDGKRYRVMWTRQGDLVFDDSKSLHYLVERDKVIILIEERIP
jgi:hypothetical protein